LCAGGGEGEDGFVMGWEAATKRALEGLQVDEEAYIVGADGDRLAAGEAEERGLAAELMVRARAALGQEAKVADEVLEKRSGGGVSVEATGAALERYSTWAARVDAQAIFTLDGTRMTIEVVNDKGVKSEVLVSAWAATRHDGWGDGGVLSADEADNYLAEMAAQMRVARDAGGASGVQLTRVVIIMDATSPVAALWRFVLMCTRRRSRVYKRHWIDTWWQTLQDFEVVVFLHQTSHMWEPANEWADRQAADAAVEHYDDARSPPLLPPSYASFEVAGVKRGVRAAVIAAARKEVTKRLQATSKLTQVWREGDLPLAALPNGLDVIAAAVLGGRCQIGDPRRFGSKLAREQVRALGCPFDCGCGFTWVDVQFVCQGSAVTLARQEWLLKVDSASRGLFSDIGPAAHGAWHELSLLTSTAVNEPSRTTAPDLGSDKELRLRRLVGGLVSSTGISFTDSSAAVRRVVGEATAAGLRVQEAGLAATKEWEEELRKLMRGLGKARKWALKWKLAVVRGGPLRAAALREATEARLLARGVRQEGLSRWGWSSAKVQESLDATRRAIRNGIIPTARALLQPPSMRQAMMEWRLVAMLRTWRLNVAVRRQRESTRLPESHVHAYVMLVARDWTFAVLPVLSLPISGKGGVGGSTPGLAERVTLARGKLRWGGGRREMVRLKRYDVAAGLEGDRFGRWAVDKVLDVARPERRKGRMLDVQVSWKGGAVRDEEGEGWQPTWVSISLLTRDLNKVAREMEEEKYGGAGRTEATTRPGKRRRSERLAAIEEEAEE